MNVLTKDAIGKIFFTTMSTFVELEVNLLSDSPKKGLEASRPRDHKSAKLHYLITSKEKSNFYMINKTYR